MAQPPKIAAGKSALYEAAWLLPDPDRPHEIKAYAELQDRMTQEFIQNNRVSGSCLAGTPFAYHTDKEDFGFQVDPARPVRNRHPILITSKKNLNIGHLTDVHVSSRQLVFRKSTARVLQGEVKKVEVERHAHATNSKQPSLGPSPEIGSLVTVTFETLKNLLDQMASDVSIDALVLTGDLIDYNRNFDPASVPDWQEHFAVPGNVWEAMHRDNHRRCGLSNQWH